MPMMKRGKIKPTEVVDISALSELNYIIKKDQTFRIGGLTTIQDLATSPKIPENYLSIKLLTKYFGAETTRNMATVGGNLASGGERDIPAIFTALDAQVKVLSRNGSRSVTPLDAKPGAGEVLVEAFFEDWGPGSVSWFTKFEKRASNGIGVVTTAVSMKVVDEKVGRIRIVLNRVEGRNMGRLVELENELTDRRLTAAFVKEAVERHVSKIRPASDFRASSDFRRHVSKILIRRGIDFCWNYLMGRSAG